MSPEPYFKDQDKLRDGDIIAPPNILKTKAGDGGLPPELLEQAESYLAENTVDFAKTAETYFGLLDNALDMAEVQTLDDSDAFETVLFPLSQLKAQGAMFHYPLVSEITAMLINFLEVVDELDREAIKIVRAYKMTLAALLIRSNKGVKEEEKDALLKEALKNACIRYFENKRKK